MRLIFRPSVLAHQLQQQRPHEQTIGIGASAHCNGQILVTDDLLGMLHDVPPKFVTEYATLRQDIDGAISKWAADVRKGVFPRAENLYTVKPSTEIKEAA